MRWVLPGQLAAGPYPRGGDVDELRAAGIDAFVDLTEAGEGGLPEYAPRLEGVEYRRLPIRDFAVPSPEEMATILVALDDLLARGRAVYLHCRGGIGRTGTVVGCYLVRHGRSAEEALASIDGPETDEQRAFVGAWPPVSDTFQGV